MTVQAQHYAATARSSDWAEDERVEGQLRVLPKEFVFLSSTGELRLPLGRVEMQVEANSRIALRDPHQPEWTVWVQDIALLRNPLIEKHPHLHVAARELRQRLESPRILKRGLVFIGGFIAVVLLGRLLSVAALNWMVDRTPVSDEIALGRKVLTVLTNHVVLVQAPELEAHLQQWTAPLIEHLPKSPYRFEFKIVASPEPNAFALPGGVILITTGLFEIVDRPEQVAGVIAHEIVHVMRRHGLRRLIRNAGPYYLLRVFVSDRQSFLMLVGSASRLIWEQSYSQKLEQEADVVAWNYLVAARIDPRGLEEFLSRVHRAASSSPLPPTKVPACLRSHPADEERVAYLRQLWQRHRPSGGFIDLGGLDRKSWKAELEPYRGWPW